MTEAVHWFTLCSKILNLSNCPELVSVITFAPSGYTITQSLTLRITFVDYIILHRVNVIQSQLCLAMKLKKILPSQCHHIQIMCILKELPFIFCIYDGAVKNILPGLCSIWIIFHGISRVLSASNDGIIKNWFFVADSPNIPSKYLWWSVFLSRYILCSCFCF